MPTPHELEVAKRQDVLRRHGNDFYVQEVVELMDSDDTDAGEEDLPRDERTSARARGEAARARPGEGRRGPRAGSGRPDVQQQAQAHARTGAARRRDAADAARLTSFFLVQSVTCIRPWGQTPSNYDKWAP